MVRGLVLVAVGLFASPLAAAEKPNVLFIAIDDLNDWIGCLKGHPQAKTPHMDALAARGTLFTNAHCQAPLCNPSRTSVLTGLRPGTTGIYALAPFFRTVPANADRETLFQFFHRNGYATASGGKIFHGPYPPGKKDGDAEGVDVWMPKARGMGKPGAKFVQTPAAIPLMDWGAFPERDEDCFDYDVATWATERLKHPPKSPFFLAIGFQHPHVPCYAPQKWFDLYGNRGALPPVKDDDRADLPRFADYLHWKLPEPRLKWLKDHNQWQPLVHAYLASISFVDDQVGRVLKALKESGHEKDTIVVLWSDHGWHLGEKGITGKNTLWERSTHVPLIFAGPGVAMGAKCQRPAELLDLYPTLADLCGLPAKANLDGHSLVPQLKDAAAPRQWPAITTHNAGNHSVRTETWRYIRYADGSEELYDVVQDPNEWTNLARDTRHAGVKPSLAKWIPAKDAAPAPHSAGRILTFDNGVPVWEGKPIGPNETLPDD